MEKIKWGIIGPGNIANNFADGLSGSYSGQLVGIASKNAERRKTFGDKYNIHEDFRFDSYEDIINSEIILLGVSRTSKIPTSIYLANRGYKTINIPLVLNQEIPEILKTNNLKPCVVGLYASAERLSDIRRNRVAIMNDTNLPTYTDLEFIRNEVENSKKLFKKYGWPIIDVTRKSVEETAASIVKIFDIRRSK